MSDPSFWVSIGNTFVDYVETIMDQDEPYVWKCEECRDCGFLVKDGMMHFRIPCSQGCPANIFTCVICHQTFPKAWTDEEAKEEYFQLHGKPIDPNDCHTVCDNCVIIVESNRPRKPHELN